MLPDPERGLKNTPWDHVPAYPSVLGARSSKSHAFVFSVFSGSIFWADVSGETTPGSTNIAVAGKWTRIEDVYPFKNGNILLIYVSLPEGNASHFKKWCPSADSSNHILKAQFLEYVDANNSNVPRLNRTPIPGFFVTNMVKGLCTTSLLRIGSGEVL